MFNVSPNGVGAGVAQSVDYSEQHGKHCGHSFLSKDVSKHEQKDAVVLPSHNNTVLNKRQFFTKWRPGDIFTNYDHWMYKILMLLCVCLTSDASNLSDKLDASIGSRVSKVVLCMAAALLALGLVMGIVIMCKIAICYCRQCLLDRHITPNRKDKEEGANESFNSV